MIWRRVLAWSVAVLAAIAGGSWAAAQSYSFSPLAGQQGMKGVDDGPARTATFLDPRALAIDGASNVYVADSMSCNIRKITPDGVVRTRG